MRLDYKLVAAVVAPLLVWPWVPAWQGGYGEAGLGSALVLFVAISVIEEILFRGFLQGGLLRRDGFKKITLGFSRANWLTSLVFAAAHLWQHPLMLIPGYFAVSLVFGYFRECYRGILVPVLLHSYYNLGLLLLGATMLTASG